MTVVTFREAINRALSDAMVEDDRVFLLGEDIAAAGGAFKATDGLLETFGKNRVRDTPISEQAIVGTAMGAALKGLRPVAELMFADFAGVAFDQIANQLAKYRYMTGGQGGVPVDDPNGQRRRRRLRRPALADGRELVPQRPRSQDRGTGLASRMPTTCCARRCATTIPCCSSSTS